MRRVIVVGSGAGGATVAAELRGEFDVTILERGNEFRPFRLPLTVASRIRSTGLLFDERLIHFAFPAMTVVRTSGGIALVTGSATGGSTTLTTGNAVRGDEGLRLIGIDLDRQFAELTAEVPMGTVERSCWQPITHELARACSEMGLHTTPVLKYGEPEKCAGCGSCVLGCRHGAGWDAREMLAKAVTRGSSLMTEYEVEHLTVERGRASGVVARHRHRRVFIPADLVVLAAGGIGTPRILLNSGIRCSDALYVDPVLTVGARLPGVDFYRERPMVFAVYREGYFVSPYFDYLSYFFDPRWRKPASDIVSLMVKLADAPVGGLSGKKVSKTLTDYDRDRLDEGVSLCRDILTRIGAKRDQVFTGMLNAGHPGGMLALTARDAGSLHPPVLPPNVYVADATLIPGPFGKPPTLTIMALAKKVAAACLNDA